ncbi:MAG: heavy metal translocating P-type ATPase [Vicinamibacterales bacterium]
MTTGATAAPACPRCAVHVESVFRVAGMDCAEEVAILRRRLTPLPGIDELSADVVGQKLHVSYDAAVLSAARIADAVAETGMRAWLEHEAPVETPDADRQTRRLVAAVAAVAAGLATPAVAGAGPWDVPWFVLAIALAGGPPLRKARASFIRRSLDINVLMVVAVAGAMAIGEWAEAATVVVLFAVSQWLEVRTMERARDAIRAVMTLAPVEARVRHGDHEHLTPVDAVAVGATIVVRPGEKIPLDGIVTGGLSDVNQAPITGESLPVDRGAGDEVFAGTINGRGALDVRVTRLVRDTTLARIVHLVEAAQAQRAPTQQFIDRFARWYTPAVVVVAAAVFAVPVAVLGQAATVWAYRALVLLVVACPCALVISTPVSIVAALAAAARRGVLVKGGAHLERLAAVRAVAFDKTGTLTHGEPHVVAVDAHPAAAAVADVTVLAAAAAIESRSEHPVARAVVAAAAARGLAVAGASDVQALPGLGAEGRWNGRHVVVGNARLMRDRGLWPAYAATADARIAAAGQSAVHVALDGALVATLAIADRPRDVAPDVVRLLRDHGVAHLAVLTGDAAAAAAAVAAAAGIGDVRAGLLPADKMAAIGDIRRAHGVVAMVGDGVNDAPALAAADVGIAMGAIGSAAALESADVALMSDELQKIPYALRLGRATLANIRVNVALSVGLKCAVLALAVVGISTLWMAVLADTGASVLVVANALRLLRHQ